MINHLESRIALLCMHHIGLYQEQEGVTISDQPVSLNDDLHTALTRYFFENFREPVFHHFTFSDGNPEMNPLYVYARTIFESPEALPDLSQSIAQYLYDHSRHPNIKAGDLMVAYVQDLLIDDEMVDGICIFKSENKQAFITIERLGKDYQLNQEFGINAHRLDKACVIFDTHQEEGYKICALDRSNKNQEAQFWMNDFLNIAPLSNDYYQTKNYIQATKGFIKERLQPLYEVDKLQETELLTRTKKYLKENEEFNSGSFEQAIFQDEEVIEHFHQYKKDYGQENKVDLKEKFSVHPSAVKNQSKVFKSVLKLDKNFHVYIHGDRSKIERGKEEDGRKFYKIYYDEEH